MLPLPQHTLPRGPALDANLPLSRLDEVLRAACAEASPESIHALRTIAAKLEARLRLAGRSALRDDLRRLRRACSAVRDLDACPPRELDAEELHARRAERARDLVRDLEARDLDALRAALSCVPCADLGASLARLADWEREFREHGRSAWRREDADLLHALRRRARRIRHAREWLGLDASAHALLHSTLGRWRDLQMAGGADEAELEEAKRAAKAAWRTAARRARGKEAAP